jgi:hypothetical protein
MCGLLCRPSCDRQTARLPGHAATSHMQRTREGRGSHLQLLCLTCGEGLRAPELRLRLRQSFLASRQPALDLLHLHRQVTHLGIACTH